MLARWRASMSCSALRLIRAFTRRMRSNVKRSRHSLSKNTRSLNPRHTAWTFRAHSTRRPRRCSGSSVAAAISPACIAVNRSWSAAQSRAMRRRANASTAGTQSGVTTACGACWAQTAGSGAVMTKYCSTSMNEMTSPWTSCFACRCSSAHNARTSTGRWATRRSRRRTTAPMKHDESNVVAAVRRASRSRRYAWRCAMAAWRRSCASATSCSASARSTSNAHASVSSVAMRDRQSSASASRIAQRARSSSRCRSSRSLSCSRSASRASCSARWRARASAILAAATSAARRSRIQSAPLGPMEMCRSNRDTMALSRAASSAAMASRARSSSSSTRCRCRIARRFAYDTAPPEALERKDAMDDARFIGEFGSVAVPSASVAGWERVESASGFAVASMAASRAARIGSLGPFCRSASRSAATRARFAASSLLHARLASDAFSCSQARASLRFARKAASRAASSLRRRRSSAARMSASKARRRSSERISAEA
mmetsp:Transcript_5387/g.17003  ORF Transcript_5387/g.17003 Transcript_5387/m.17003 type:complete len:489 (-) Transcript_5387:279-1745(-)